MAYVNYFKHREFDCLKQDTYLYYNNYRVDTLKQTVIKRKELFSTEEVKNYIELLEKKLAQAHDLLDRTFSLSYDNETRFYNDVKAFLQDDLFVVIDENYYG